MRASELLTETGRAIRKGNVKIIQINLGNKCNQSCVHCHQEASSQSNNNMSSGTAQNILKKLSRLDVESVEFTGGAPELNPNLEIFIEELSKYNKKITVRTNLTVLDLPEYSFYADLYKKHRVKIVASLPCVYEENVDRQRGAGVYQTSIKVLKRLNNLGYGGPDLVLELVYNPGGNFLPAAQSGLEKLYKQTLKDKYEIGFNRLLSLTNVPIKRFKRFLVEQGKLEEYLDLLTRKYNPDTLANLMCRDLLSVDYKGDIYDCDFNLALNLRVKDYEEVKFWELDDWSNFKPEITLAEHCYACTAGAGSSCFGSLVE